MANEVVLRFAGDSKQLERTMDNVGRGAKEMAGDLDSASTEARKFGGAMDRAGNAADASESKFMGMADLLDGLGGAFGLPTEGATNLMRSFGDLSGGFAALQPLVTGMATAVRGFAMTLLTPPMGIVVAIAALVTALVVAYQKSETFRDIVNGVFNAVARAVGEYLGFVLDRISDLVGAAAAVAEKIPGLGGVAEKLREAQDRIDGMAASVKTFGNNTDDATGKVRAFTGELEHLNRVPINQGLIPQRAPGGGPVFMQHGGPVQAGVPYIVGERRPELFVPNQSGYIHPRVPAGGGTTVVVNVAGSVVTQRDLVDSVHEGLLRKQRQTGNLGIEAA